VEGVHVAYMGRKEIHSVFWWGNLHKNELEHRDIDVKIY
jgi:hypothetical protein